MQSHFFHSQEKLSCTIDPLWFIVNNALVPRLTAPHFTVSGVKGGRSMLSLFSEDISLLFGIHFPKGLNDCKVCYWFWPSSQDSLLGSVLAKSSTSCVSLIKTGCPKQKVKQ